MSGITQGAYPVEMSAGSVVQCHCGRYWFRTRASFLAPLYKDYFDEELLGPRWLRVRWWNFTARKRIRETERQAPS